ncbi:hypothetical protein BTO06_02970 [Tenacibaculum sp. SZ-18]|uniref:hypothetical protein n=1 Tax=Tenacibaculum sp. SZ-18 TaxID=754423 RepID=UPI000C2D5978|nr:hypothetical protein [Tenacibaculum sp. SZ-18]AUC14173.1 hypothetical protein BTO06_02970 [Tenacibaculum sp. SZ-18]
MGIINKIKIIKDRSEFAYQEYLKNKKYYQAKRIYNANTELMAILKEFQFLCDNNIIEDLYRCIFHLEDWFLQFEKLESGIHNLDEDFVFTRLEYSFEFPSEFFNKLNEL